MPVQRLCLNNYISHDALGVSGLSPYQSRDGQLWLPSPSDGDTSLTAKQNHNFNLVIRALTGIEFLRCRRSNL